MALTREIIARLTVAARQAAAGAYAPYSRFPVGAAVLGADGNVYASANVENASFGLTMCAERNAIFEAIAHGAGGIAAVAVYTPTPQPTPPCGACRQVLREFADDAPILCIGDGDAMLATTLKDLLPNAFGPDNL
jgi:cytidine deaminase